jgi:hypothetical protein
VDDAKSLVIEASKAGTFREVGERNGYPMTMMAVDDDALRQILRQCCQQLSGKKCRWALFVEKGSAAEQITRAEILRDAKPQGFA